MDAWGAPQRVLLAHPSDQIAQLTLDPGSPCPTLRFPAPIGLEPCAMPPQDGVRLYDPSQTKQARPASGHPYQQRPVTTPQPETLRCAPQDDGELMTKKEVLDFKPTPRLEQIGDIHSEQMDDRKHHFG